MIFAFIETLRQHSLFERGVAAEVESASGKGRPAYVGALTVGLAG